jgi:hypothetical protein
VQVIRLILAVLVAGVARYREGCGDKQDDPDSAVKHEVYFFLPWVLPGILVTCVFPVQERWARAPDGYRWSSLAAVERPRTAQGRPRQRLGAPKDGLRADGQLSGLLACLGP